MHCFHSFNGRSGHGVRVGRFVTLTCWPAFSSDWKEQTMRVGLRQESASVSARDDKCCGQSMVGTSLIGDHGSVSSVVMRLTRTTRSVQPISFSVSRISRLRLTCCCFQRP